MSKTIRYFVAPLMFGLVLAVPSAKAQIPVTDGLSLGEAILEWVETAIQWGTEAEQWAQDYEQLKSLTNQLGGSLNANSASDMQQGLNAVRQYGNAVSGSSSQVKQRMDEAYGSNVGEPLKDVVTSMRTTKDTLRAANTSAALQQDSLVTEAERMNQLGSQSNSASGVLEVQQAGNQINLEVAQQLQKMRAQQLIQDQATNAAALEKQNQREANMAITGMFFGKGAATAGAAAANGN